MVALRLWMLVCHTLQLGPADTTSAKKPGMYSQFRFSFSYSFLLFQFFKIRPLAVIYMSLVRKKMKEKKKKGKVALVFFWKIFLVFCSCLAIHRQDLLVFFQ